MPYLPTSLRLYQPKEEGITYNPYEESRSERIGEALNSTILGLLQTMEQARQQNRQRSIVEKILKQAGVMPESILSPETTPTMQQQYPETAFPSPAKKPSMIGNILGRVRNIFDVNQPPQFTTPIETSIAEAVLKRKQEPKGVWAKSGLTNLARNKILGALQTGFYVHPLTNQRLPVKTKEQAINFIQQQGYMNYGEDPEITNIINKLPSETQRKTEAQKGWFLGGQKTTKTAEQRFNELVASGISEDEAYRQLIKEGY